MSGIVGSYLNTRGSGVVAKLGTDGQVFTSTGAGLSQGFEAAAGGGAWNLIKSQTITSSTASMLWIDGTNDVTFDSTYKNYVLVVTDYIPATDGSALHMNISTDTGSSYETSGYITTGAQAQFDGGGSSEGLASNVTTSMFLKSNIGSASSEAAYGTIWLFNPSGSASKPCVQQQWSEPFASDGKARATYGVGSYQTATAYDAFQIIPSTGDIENLQASLYGVST